MKLPPDLVNKREWTLLGPMGPELSPALRSFPLLGVDGGANFCEKMDLWIGDGDSIEKKVNASYQFPFPSKKSLSDLALAFSLFESSELFTLHCWGFLGGRRDHELLNFGEALRFLEQKPQSEILFYGPRSGRISVKCVGAGDWNQQHQGLFSVASLNTTRVKILGSCEYPLQEMTDLPALSSLGLSNSASGNFQVLNEGPVMIIFPENT